MAATLGEDGAMADDFAGNASTTGQVIAGGSVSGQLEVPGDRDWFRVQLVAGHQYSITEEGWDSGNGTLPDPYLRLYDVNSSLVAQNDDSATSSDSLIGYLATQTGTYYVAAGSFVDGGAGSYVVTLTDTSPNSPPQIVSNGGGSTAAVSVPENSTATTTVVAADPDPGTAISYSLVGGPDQGLFQINTATGALSFIAPPDFENPADADHNNSYLVTVRASDGVLFADQAITV